MAYLDLLQPESSDIGGNGRPETRDLRIYCTDMAKVRTIDLDTSIDAYRSKRNFAATPEPRVRSDAAGPKQMFVVQKHAAHRAVLYWDFRLERNGVLWGWAVPKGPSLDPADKRTAIHVEDHPVEYADFAGNSPTCQYGGGHVDLWDRGTWEPMGDLDEGMRKGELKFLSEARVTLSR